MIIIHRTIAIPIPHAYTHVLATYTFNLMPSKPYPGVYLVQKRLSTSENRSTEDHLRNHDQGRDLRRATCTRPARSAGGDYSNTRLLCPVSVRPDHAVLEDCIYHSECWRFPPFRSPSLAVEL